MKQLHRIKRKKRRFIKVFNGRFFYFNDFVNNFKFFNIFYANCSFFKYLLYYKKISDFTKLKFPSN